MDAHGSQLLTINTGSSSLKAAVYRFDESQETRILAAEARGIGLASSRITVVDATGQTLLERNEKLGNHAAALDSFLGWLRDHDHANRLRAIGHRVVRGGNEHAATQWIDRTFVENLRRLVPLAPDHLPQSIAAIEKLRELLPNVPQAACFDTAFHSTLPRCARLLALPRALADEGIVRFGFHGLSCEYIVEQLRAADPVNVGGRAVIAHLGSGASMTAVRQGTSVDTSMGFTPTGGLVMSTRSGDLDPGVLVYLLRAKGLTPDQLNDVCNRQAGLLGISATSPDMRLLLEKRADDERAAEAVEVFCYQARKFLGAYAAVLGGIDTIVFTGGIGENAAYIRQRICADLDFLGIELDPKRNRAHAAVISADASKVMVRVIETDEDSMIAKHTYRLLATKEA